MINMAQKYGNCMRLEKRMPIFFLFGIAIFIGNIDAATYILHLKSAAQGETNQLAIQFVFALGADALPLCSQQITKSGKIFSFINLIQKKCGRRTRGFLFVEVPGLFCTSPIWQNGIYHG